MTPEGVGQACDDENSAEHTKARVYLRIKSDRGSGGCAGSCVGGGGGGGVGGSRLEGVSVSVAGNTEVTVDVIRLQWRGKWK